MKQQKNIITMKNLILTLFTLFSVTAFSQEYTSWENVTYYGSPAVEIHSDWFDYNYIFNNDKDLTIEILPKNGESFSMNDNSVKNRVDEKKVRGYLTQSLNEFRDDYNLKHGVENEGLTKICNDYVKTLKGVLNLKHSNLYKNPYSPKLNKEYSFLGEGITFIPYDLFSLIPDSVDLNKVITDHIFDGLASCPLHAKPLVRNYNIFEIGFGLDFRETGIMVVLQYVDKK
jgi:hypothetical protein